MAPRSIKTPPVAVIDEQACIGCAQCTPACPVDAIVGASQFMHTVITEECIGCGLCLPPCPVDCIAMVETGKTPNRSERKRRAERARARNSARLARLERERSQRTAAESAPGGRRGKQATIERIMQRARERLRQR